MASEVFSLGDWAPKGFSSSVVTHAPSPPGRRRLTSRQSIRPWRVTRRVHINFRNSASKKKPICRWLIVCVANSSSEAPASHPRLPSARRGASPTPPRLVSDTPPPPGVYTAFVARRRRRRCGREEISARRPREPQPRAPLRADPPFAAATLAAAQPAAVHAPQPHPTLPSPGNRYRHGLFTELPPPGAAQTS